MIYRAIVAELKRRLVETALWRAGGNRTRAAEMLGIDRTNIQRYVRGDGADGRAAQEFRGWLLDMALLDNVRKLPTDRPGWPPP